MATALVTIAAEAGLPAAALSGSKPLAHLNNILGGPSTAMEGPVNLTAAALSTQGLLERSDAHSAPSSVLSSLDSSDLSSVDSDFEDAVKRKVKRRRKNNSTPGTSVDEQPKRQSKKNMNRIPSQSEFEIADRKDYFAAGLYSGATNSFTGRAPTQRRAGKGEGRLSRAREDIIATFKFELPMYHGLAVLEQAKPFRLPWDILNDFDLSRLPETPEGVKFRSDALDRVGQQMRPTSYKQISQNRLIWRQKDEAERQAICDCPVGECGDSCLNRIMQFFCSPKLCRSGKACTNLPFSMKPETKHDLQVYWTGNRGFGLRTNTAIKAGDFVMQYVGEIITINESYRRTVEDYKDRHDYYFLHYYDGEVVDAGLMGNESRFINHSCEPNLQVVRWKLADFDEYQIGMFALRDIDPKEELCYDYGWQAFSSIDSKDVQGDPTIKAEAPKQPCYCAAPSCTGFLEKAEKMKEKKAALLSKVQGKQKAGLKRSQSSKGKKQ